MFPYDFRDDRLMKQLKDMTAMIVHICPELRREVGLIMLNLTSKVSGGGGGGFPDHQCCSNVIIMFCFKF